MERTRVARVITTAITTLAHPIRSHQHTTAAFSQILLTPPQPSTQSAPPSPWTLDRLSAYLLPG